MLSSLLSSLHLALKAIQSVSRMHCSDLDLDPMFTHGLPLPNNTQGNIILYFIVSMMI